MSASRSTTTSFVTACGQASASSTCRRSLPTEFATSSAPLPVSPNSKKSLPFAPTAKRFGPPTPAGKASKPISQNTLTSALATVIARIATTHAFAPNSRSSTESCRRIPPSDRKEAAMARRAALASVVVVVFAGIAWLRGDKPAPPWVQVAPGVWRSTAAPFGHALESDGHALLIDAPHDLKSIQNATIKTIDGVLLTHHHLD